jgi:tungstate transport system ATP-binding protein
LTEVYQLKNISKYYESITALEKISLQIDEEKIIGIIGHSGAGKTTLLKILAGLENPSSGRIWFQGREVGFTNLHWLRKRVTMIFQTPLFLTGDVQSNLAYGLKIRGIPESKIETRIKDTLANVRLDGYSDREARELSGGEQQRAALARALLLDPEVLLLDEPTSNLDPANIRVISDIIEKESEKRCIVIATHDFDQIKRLAERVLYLENGTIKEEGPPGEIYSITKLTDNVYSGETTIQEGIAILDTGRIKIKATGTPTGKNIIHVRPQDIIVSKTIIETSARNQFKGKITRIEDLGSLIKLHVDAGEGFIVQITKRSFKEMNLNMGTIVFLNFKASSVMTL